MATGKQMNRPQYMTPAFTGDDLRKALSRYDRQPFMDVLAAWMECAPTAEEVLAFAAKKPDAYIKAVSDLARMAGYTDKREVEVNLNLKLGAMSDSQLEDRMRELANTLNMELPQIDSGADDAQVIDITDNGEELSPPSPHKDT